MVSTREIKGSKEEIVEQIGKLNGRIVSAILVMEEPVEKPFVPPTEEEIAGMKRELEGLAVSVGNVDWSREAMYTRMPGE